MSFCSKYLDVIKDLPLYDENVSFQEHHQKRRIWESIKRMNFQSSKEFKSFFEEIKVPIDGVPFSGKIDAEYEYSSSFFEEYSRERLMEENNDFINYKSTKELNKKMTEAILGCAKSQTRGLSTQLVLSDNWKKFSIRIGYHPFVQDDGIRFEFFSTGPFKTLDSEPSMNEPFYIGSGLSKLIHFERIEKSGADQMQTDAGTIEIRPVEKDGKPTQKFSPVSVNIPWASRDLHIFDGDFEVRTNWYDPESKGRGPVRNIPFRINPKGDEEHKIRDHHNQHDWLYVSLNYDETKRQHSAKVFLSAPAENKADGITKAQAEISEYNQPTGIRRARNDIGWHHAEFNAVMKTRYVEIDALDYDDIVENNIGVVTAGGEQVYMLDPSKLKQLEKKSAANS